jgi:hypothetical protein
MLVYYPPFTIVLLTIITPSEPTYVCQLSYLNPIQSSYIIISAGQIRNGLLSTTGSPKEDPWPPPSVWRPCRPDVSSATTNAVDPDVPRGDRPGPKGTEGHRRVGAPSGGQVTC